MASARKGFLPSSNRDESLKKQLDMQEKIVDELYEMFGKNIEIDAIRCIADSCDWKSKFSLHLLFKIIEIILYSNLKPKLELSKNYYKLSFDDIWACKWVYMTN